MLNISRNYVLLEYTFFFSFQAQPVIWYENEPPGPVVKLIARDNDSIDNGPPFTFAIDETQSHDVDYRSKFSISG